MAAPPIGDVELLRGLPAWAKVVFVWGPLAAISLFVVYIGAKNLPDIRLELAAQREEVKALHGNLDEIKQELEQLNETMQWTCVSLAKTDADRKGCLAQ